jgi:ABC-type Fe3+-hydroxamate transport system substrate-binding protein
VGVLGKIWGEGGNFFNVDLLEKFWGRNFFSCIEIFWGGKNTFWGRKKS